MSLAFVPMSQRGKVPPNQTSIQKVLSVSVIAHAWAPTKRRYYYFSLTKCLESRQSAF